MDLEGMRMRIEKVAFAKELVGATYYIAGVILVSATLIALLVFLYQKKFVMRKGKETNVEPQKVNFISARELVDTEEVRDGISINHKKRKYTFALHTEGFDFFNSSASMQLEAVKSFQSLLRSMTDPFQFHLASRKIDIKDTVAMYEQEALIPLHNVIKDVDAEIAREYTMLGEYLATGKMELYNESQRILESLLADRKARILDLELLEEQDLYLGAISTGDSADVREAYYAASYVHDPSAYSKKLNKHEVFKRAAEYCNSLYAKLDNGLSSSGVRCSRLDDEDTVKALRRGMQPFYADAIPLSQSTREGEKFAITSDVAEQLERLAEREKWEMSYMKYLKEVQDVEITEEAAERLKAGYQAEAV